MTGFEKASLILSIFSSMLSALAIVKSVSTAKTIHREQTALAKETREKQAELSAKMHADQLLLSQRQLFLEIWPKLSTLNDVDPAKAVAVDVINAVNVLELVGLCWEGGMVDSNVIRRSFGERFVAMYDRVHAVPKLPPSIGKSGADLINENPAIGKLYEVLRKELLERGALTPIRAA